MINHNKPYLNNKDINALKNVCFSGFIASGEKVKKLEEAMVRYLGGRGSACAVSSGTSALYLALVALNIKAGDEIILPTYVCSALLNAIFMKRAVPVLVDVNLSDFNLTFEEAKKAISKRTKAIIVPHMYGAPADLDRFKTLGIPIIEDCAQAIGAKYKTKKVGTIGDISIFSFYATKLLTTGQGGMVYSKNKNLIEKVKDYIDFDYRKKYYPRFNFKMADLQAALGISQLTKLNMFLERREEIAFKYSDILIDKGVNFQTICAEAKRVFYRYVLRIRNSKKLKQIMFENGIQTIVPIESWELLHRYLGKDNKKYLNAEKISRESLSLPIYPGLKNNELKQILQILKREKACWK